MVDGNLVGICRRYKAIIMKVLINFGDYVKNDECSDPVFKSV